MTKMRSCGLLGFLVAAFILLAAIATTAGAEDAFSLPMFSPGVFGGRYLSVDDAATLDTLGYGFGIYYDFAPSLLTYYIDDEPEFDTIDHLQSLHVNAALGILDWWAIGVQMPAHAVTDRKLDDPARPSERTQPQDSGLLAGDLKVEMKFRALVQDRHEIGLALLPFVRVPTGNPDRLVGEGRATGGARLALERDFGPVDAALTGGYLARGTTELFGVEIGDALLFGAAVGREFENGLGIGLEFSGRRYSVEDTDRIFNTPMELLLNLHYRFGARGPRLVGAGGPGLTTGVGTPPYRVVGGVDYYPEKVKTGTLVVEVIDESGNPVAADVTVSGPDSAPSLKRVTRREKWSLDPGAYTVAAKADGRSDDQAAADIASGRKTTVRLHLPIEKKVESGVVIAVTDQCTGEPVGGRVVFEDGTDVALTGGKARRLMPPGEHHGTLSAPGYPDRDLTVTVESGRISELSLQASASVSDLSEKIAFAVSSADVTPSMERQLDKIADAIRRNCGIKRIVVEGHTDEQENPELAERRARSVVEYLVGKGVDAGILSPIGLGSTRPTASNAMAWGREQNRRVELRVEE